MSENLSENKKIPKFKAYKIVVAVAYALVTLFLVGFLIYVCVSPTDNFKLAIALYLSLVLILIGGPSNAVCAVLSTVGLILSAVKRKDGCENSTLVYFAVFAGLPILTEFLLILICYSMC